MATGVLRLTAACLSNEWTIMVMQVPTAAPTAPYRGINTMIATRFSPAAKRLIATMALSFVPLDGPEAETIRVLLCLKGEQWIELASGSWEMHVLVGEPDRGVPLRLHKHGFTVARRKAYALELSERLEQELKRKLRGNRPALDRD